MNGEHIGIGKTSCSSGLNSRKMEIWAMGMCHTYIYPGMGARYVESLLRNGATYVFFVLLGRLGGCLAFMIRDNDRIPMQYPK